MIKKGKILCMVPLSPPIQGPSVASEAIINHLKTHYEIIAIPLQKEKLISSKFFFKQFFNVLSIGIRLKFHKKDYDSVYIVISSTFWGNLRDMFLLIMLGNRLRRKVVLHLHGANIDNLLNKSSFWIKMLNKKLLSNINTAIVLGETFENIFDGYIPRANVKIVKNFFNSYLLINEERLHEKFHSIEKVNILFLSNLIKEKGYELMLDAFLSLPDDISNKAELHFGGTLCSSSQDNEIFLNKIKSRDNIFYHGLVTGEKKRELLWKAHIFCLPTFFKIEGQPISILEAYASGCIVLTTSNGGINDIFVNNANGLTLDVDINSKDSLLKERMMKELGEKLKIVITDICRFEHIAYFNCEEARHKYAEALYCKNMEKILTGKVLKGE
jgi:glycosyltransferase involved in cell wall biosynthesis